MAPISLVSANLSALVVDTLFYGMFFLLSCWSTYLLVQRERRVRSRLTFVGLVTSPIFLSGIFMLLTVTGHWLINVYRAFQAFDYFDGGMSALSFYSDLALPSAVARNALICISLLSFDFVMIYRLWVIWGHNRLAVLFPSLSFLGSIASNLVLIYQFSRLKSGDLIFAIAVDRWVKIVCALTLSTNVTSAVLIAWKLWTAHSRVRSYGRSMLQALEIFIESASIYVALTIMYTAAYVATSNLQFPFVDAWVPLSGIGFALINVRIAAGWGSHNAYFNASAQSKESAGTLQETGVRSTMIPMNPVVVDVLRVVDRDSGGEMRYSHEGKMSSSFAEEA